jgi:hypothetical protein
MIILQIEHPIRSFDAWKAAFDSDPAHREQSGVRGYRVFRPVDDSLYVIIELAFDALAEAETFLVRMRQIWTRVDGTLVMNPRTRIVDMIEDHQYAVAP